MSFSFFRSTLIIPLLFLLAILTKSQTNPPSLIIELFRHGSRGPNDNIWDPTWDPLETSELTPTGMRMHYILGKVLRKEYTKRYGSNFLVSEYSPDKVYVRSTNVNRTIMSAYAHLYGIFEGNGYPYAEILDANTTLPPFYNNDALIQKITKSLRGGPALPKRFLPYADHIVKYEEDYVLAAEGSCYDFGKWREKNVQSETYRVMISRYQESLDELKKMGYNLSNWYLINDFADTIIVNHRENRTLPGNLTWDSQIIQDIVFLYNWGSVFTQFGQEIQTRVIPTPLLNFILDHSQGVLNGTLNEQLVLLSAHDDSLLTFLTPLGIVTPDCIFSNFLNPKKPPYPNCQYPTFASSIRIEVFNQTLPHATEPIFRFYYNGNEVQVCNGTGYCTFKDFTSLIKKITNNNNPNDFPKICNNPKKMSLSDNFNYEEYLHSNLTLILGVAVGLLIVLNIWQFIKCIKNKKEQNESILPESERREVEANLLG